MQVLKLELAAKLKSSLDKVAEKLKSISYLTVLQKEDSVSAASVEVTDIKGNPYVFSVFEFYKDKIRVRFSVPEGKSILSRIISVLKKLMNILSILGTYEVSQDSLVSLLESLLDFLEKTQTDVSKEKLLIENQRLKKKIADLEERLREKSFTVYNLKLTNDALRKKLSKYEKISDQELMLKIEDWVRDHGGEIDLEEFCKVYGVSINRVEEILDKMVKEGYLEVVS